MNYVPGIVSSSITNSWIYAISFIFHYARKVLLFSGPFNANGPRYAVCFLRGTKHECIFLITVRNYSTPVFSNIASHTSSSEIIFFL